MVDGARVVYTMPGYTGYGYPVFENSSDGDDYGWCEEAEESDELDKYALLSNDDADRQVYTNS